MMATARTTTETPSESDRYATVKPGSSKKDDAKVGAISEKAARKIPTKRLRTYRFIQMVLGPPIRWVFRVKRIHRKKLPKRGGIILASNHVSWFDPVMVVASINRPLSALGKSYLFRGWFRTWFFETLGGQIRVDRERGGNLAAVNAAVEAVRNGRLIGVWPEGGRSPTGHLTRGKTGVARIALAANAPIYPVAVLGTFELKSKHSKRIKWGTPVRVVFGDPIHFPEHAGKHEDRAVCREVTDRIMLEVAKLMGPDEEVRYRELLKQDVPPGELPLDKREA